MLIYRTYGWILALAWVASAWVLTPSALQDQAVRTRDAQLREFQQSYMPEYDSYIGVGWVYLPLPSQSRLQTPYGLHDGFAFRHRFALLLQNPIEKTAYRVGLAWWVERQGWEQEDFLAMAPYEHYGLVRDLHTAAVMFSDTKRSLGLAAGVQWQNPEHVGTVYAAETDSLWWFSHAVWNHMSLQAVFHRLEWQTMRVNANLADRALLGGARSGLTTYWPDLEASFRRGEDDPLCVRIRQNLYAQKIFLDAAWRPVLGEEGSATLLFYPDPSELVGAEFGVVRNSDGKWRVGGGLEIPLLRVAYNAPRDADELFGSHGTWIVELHVSLGAISQKSIFRRNAPQAAPMESKVTHDYVEPKEDSNINGKSDFETHELKATPNKDEVQP